MISTFTGKIAPKKIVSDLMKAHEIDEKHYTTFKGERLQTHQQ